MVDGTRGEPDIFAKKVGCRVRGAPCCFQGRSPSAGKLPIGRQVRAGEPARCQQARLTVE